MTMRRFLSGFVIGTLMAVIALELGLRLLPVNSGLRMAPTSDAMPISRYLAQQPYVYSLGWALANPMKGETNRLGFTRSADEVRPGGVLVIGDSYIEAQMLEYRDTLQGRLDAALPGRVMAASASGNGLADALRIIEAFAPVHRPAAVVVLVEPTDLSGLLDAPSAGHNGFVLRAGEVAVVHQPYTESRLKTLLTKSALVRYVYYNLKFPGWWARLRAQAADSADGSAAATTAAATGHDGRRQALAWFMARLRTLADAGGFKVLFLIDGDRRALYADRPDPTAQWDRADRQALLGLAAAQGHQVIDLDPVFAAHWRKRQERLDWSPHDWHWNAVAHDLAAQTVLERLPAAQATTIDTPR
ncbi:MAG TPA: hypothetical protein PK359_17380 [Burkholderiaceae bacterium]|nr:hypothetical protein [Burkholderiaceae bacterium]